MKKHNLILLLIVLAITATGFKCTKTDVEKVAFSNQGTILLARNIQQRTSADSVVYSKAGLSADQITTIQAGLEDAFRDARTSGYTNRLNAPFYEIYTPPYNCVPSPEQRIPSFLIRADDYDGSEFDQYNPRGRGVTDGRGVVYASEQVFGLGTTGSTPEIGQMLVCPDSPHLQNAVRHGAEHILVANNNMDYYALTWYHGNGFYHPILPERSAFASRGGKPISNQKFVVHPVK